MRIVIIGTSCSGKSTFARHLAAAQDCRYVELDELYWGPNWTTNPEPEFLQAVAQAAKGDTWVIAGNYGHARNLLWARATDIVWLNYSLPVVFWRGLKRTIARVYSREVLFHDNRESFLTSFLSRESILWWILSTYHRRRREFESLRASGQFRHLQWHELRSPRNAAGLLKEKRGRSKFL
jgi:adenylate kinase family enzyme